MTNTEIPIASIHDGDAPQSKALAEQQHQQQQPGTDPTPATSYPPSLADTLSTIGAKRADTIPTLSHTTVAQTKVAIPRQRAGIAPRYNRRVPRACESCRQRKTKCSGDTPVCRQCRELRATCNYPQGWRERTKKLVDLWLYVQSLFLSSFTQISRTRMLTDCCRIIDKLKIFQRKQ